MQTYGIIWPDGTKELRSLSQDESGEFQWDIIKPMNAADNWEKPQVLPLVKLDKPKQGEWNPNVVWFSDRVERQWVAGTPPPPELFTPEDWTARFFTAAQILALQRFEFALQQAGKPLPPAMLSLKQWLEAMLLASADPTPRTFSEPPCGYADAAAEAVARLQS